TQAFRQAGVDEFSITALCDELRKLVVNKVQRFGDCAGFELSLGIAFYLFADEPQFAQAGARVCKAGTELFPDELCAGVGKTEFCQAIAHQTEFAREGGDVLADDGPKSFEDGLRSGLQV